MRLYELTDTWRQVHALAQDGEDVTDTLDSITDGIEDKVEGIAKVVKSIEAEAKAIKEEETRLADRRKAMENRVKQMKQYAEESMRAVGMSRIKGALFTVAIQKNPPSVEVLDEGEIPEGYWVPQPPKLNRKEIVEALKLGIEIPGAELKQGESLRIR